MSYSAIVARIENLRKHSNADKLQVATILGEQVIVGLDTQQNDLGIYFPCDGCLSQDFLQANNLIGYIDEAGNKKGGFFAINGRVRAQKFRGEMSDGFWCPLSYLEKIPNIGKISLKEGDSITTINGIEICRKYVTKATIKKAYNNIPTKNKVNKIKTNLVFPKHFETEHLNRNLHKLIPGSIIYITEKQHGTSARYSNAFYQKYSLTLLSKIFPFLKKKYKYSESNYIYSYGSRRVDLKKSDGDFYGDNQFRFDIAQPWIQNLYKGEIIYGEIVGFLPNGKPIMASVSTDTVKDKEFQKKYGKNITWSYGCQPNECKFYVYRIAMINEDGIEIDLSFNQMIKRAESLNLNTVQLIYEPLYVRTDNILVGLESDNIYQIEQILDICKKCTNGNSLFDTRHPKEGCTIRIENKHKLNYLKYKTNNFKILEGLLKDNDNYVDEEEAQNETKEQ